MAHRIQFAIVILVGAGLLAWVAVSTRYIYVTTATGQVSRNDGWTGTRQLLKCEEKPTGQPVLTTSSSTTASSGVDQEHASRLPAPSAELERINQLRQERHMAKVDQWGRELMRVCRWVNFP